jgi:CHRD domain
VKELSDMKSLSLFGLLVLGCVVTGCGGDGDKPTAPSPAASVMFTAALLPSSEVPPVTGSEASGSGTATLTFNLTKDAAGTITAATMDATVSVNGFPAGTALTASHIHPGAPGANGGIFVSLGLAAGEVSFPTGSGSFTKRGVSLTVDEANAIIANPAAFYLNIHTAANAGGVARGQLTRVQ